MNKILKNNIQIINQRGILKYLNRFKKADIQLVTLDTDTWYDQETDDGTVFCWSKPESRILLNGINRLEITVSCPIGRIIGFKGKGINQTVILKRDVKHTFNIETRGLTELLILSESYTPENDERCLGICLWNLDYKV